jgi:hypothetical protein
MRYEVRVTELDDSEDIVRVWAASADEAVRRVLDFIDYAERRPLYDRPVSVTELGATPDSNDLGRARNWNDVFHRRVSRDGRELGTLRRPNLDHLAEMASHLRGATTRGWQALRSVMEASGLSPAKGAVVSEILDDERDPVSGILIMADGTAYGFFRNPEGAYSIGGSREWQPPEALAPTRDAALQYLAEDLD